MEKTGCKIICGALTTLAVMGWNDDDDDDDDGDDDDDDDDECGKSIESLYYTW